MADGVGNHGMKMVWLKKLKLRKLLKVVGLLKALRQMLKGISSFLMDHGQLTLTLSDLETPNGILMTPDGKTMYVVDNNPEDGGARTLLAFTIFYQTEPVMGWCWICRATSI